MKKKYIVYHGTDEKGDHVYIFGALKNNGDVNPMVRFAKIKELHEFLEDYNLEEVVLLEKGNEK